MKHTISSSQIPFPFDEPTKHCTCEACERAGQLLPFSEFYKDKYAPDGVTYQCKKCMNAGKYRYMQTAAGKESHKKYMQSEKGKAALFKHAHSDLGRKTGRIKTARRRKNPEQKRIDLAYKTIHDLVRSKMIPKAKELNCDLCGQPAKEYHHYLGYEPEHHLDVIPVCRECHIRVHHPTD